MSKERFYLKWGYNEPRHPKETHGEFTWKTGIGTDLFKGYFLVFDEDTTLNQWKAKEIERWENLMKDFKQDNKVQSLATVIRPNEEKIKDIESDNNFIKWI